MPWYEATKENGIISIITGNHDTPRISHGLDAKETALAFAMIFTMPGAPFLYYGDEIGMRYLKHLKTKEGGYSRTGSRTPMQWNSEANAGFSLADTGKEHLYLPIDSCVDAINVETQEKDPQSLLNTVKALLRLRQSEEDLQTTPNLEILHAPAANNSEGDRSFIYKRGNCLLAVNPGKKAVSVPVAANAKTKNLFSIGGCSLENGICILEPQSFGVWKF